MALPHRRQRLPRFIKYRDLTNAEFAQAVGITTNRLANLIQGHVYPSPEELDRIEAFFFPFSLANLFDPEMLVYRHGPWPPPTGVAALKAELARAQAQLDSDRHEAGE